MMRVFLGANATPYIPWRREEWFQMLNNTARVIAKAVVVLGICVIAVGIVMRIAWVNDTALELPAVETHEMHENVSFDGAFLSFASENTSGYSVNVTNAENISNVTAWIRVKRSKGSIL